LTFIYFNFTRFTGKSMIALDSKPVKITGNTGKLVRLTPVKSLVDPVLIVDFTPQNQQKTKWKLCLSISL
ncbi:hypothetical protein, partial [Chlorogloeopsis fritschii]|uniref:hypothetical protein n=1 Tax=Chlorogloeopsis fritschii TaxID=1124 RepID=UPI0023F0CA15